MPVWASVPVLFLAGARPWPRSRLRHSHIVILSSDGSTSTGLRLAFVAIFIITPHQEPGRETAPFSALVPKRVASARKSNEVKVLDWWSQAESNPDLLNAIQARYLSSPECRRDRHPRFPSRSFDLLGCPHGSGSSMSAAAMLTLGSRTSFARSTRAERPLAS